MLIVRVEAELAAVRPEVAGQFVLFDEGHVVFEPGAQLRKEVVEDVPHCQHGGPGVDGSGGRGDGANLASDSCVSFQQCHGIPCCPKSHCAGKASGARADDHGALRGGGSDMGHGVEC